MKVCRTAGEIAGFVGSTKAGSRRVAFVPTMGALHDGHMSLVRAAHADNTSVIMSIFVNPLQFGAGEDLAAYPRDEERDLALAETESVHAVFVPRVDEIYPPGHLTKVSVAGTLAAVLEGEVRPGHFDGVATVVAALFGIVAPDSAFFGEKDAQQLAVVRRMTADLRIPVGISACPIVREPDGLALSSRNAYLSPGQRQDALALHRSLQVANHVHSIGGLPLEAAEAAWDVLSTSPGVEPGYAAAVDPDTFEPATGTRPYRVCVAAYVGTIRLIDNVALDPATRRAEGTTEGDDGEMEA